MDRRKRALLLIVAITGPAVLASSPSAANVVPSPTVEVWSNATRADGVQAVQIDPGGQVEIRWKGFTPNMPVVITQCRHPDFVALYLSARWNNGLFHCAHQTRRYAQTGANGEGSLSAGFKAGTFNQTQVSNYQGNSVFECNGATDPETGLESSCIVTVSECEWSQPLTFTKTGSVWQLVPNPRTDLADPALAAASRPVRIKNPNGVPVRTVNPAPPKPRVEVKAPEPLPTPQAPQDAPINGAGSVNISEVVTDWLVGVRAASPARDVSYLRGTSVLGASKLKQGFSSGFAQGSDFAITGLSHTREETGGEVAYAPISLTGLSIANGVEFGGLGLAGTRMSPDSVATMFGLNGQWSDSSFQGPTVNDNRGCGLPQLNKKAVLRAGQSAQNKVISSWLGATLPSGRFAELYESAPGDLVLDPRAVAFDQTSADNGAIAAEYIATLGGKGVNRIEVDGKTYQESNETKQLDGMLGFTDATQVAAAKANGYVINSAPVKNAAGRYVLPTKEAVLDAFGTMTRNADGTYSPVFDRADRPDAYPLPMVHYVMVPKADASGRNPLPPAKRKTLAAFIEYAISDAGQHKLAELGAPALPQQLRAQAEEVVRMLRTPDPEQPPAPRHPPRRPRPRPARPGLLPHALVVQPRGQRRRPERSRRRRRPAHADRDPAGHRQPEPQARQVPHLDPVLDTEPEHAPAAGSPGDNIQPIADSGTPPETPPAASEPDPAILAVPSPGVSTTVTPVAQSSGEGSVRGGVIPRPRGCCPRGSSPRSARSACCSAAAGAGTRSSEAGDATATRRARARPRLLRHDEREHGPGLPGQPGGAGRHATGGRGGAGGRGRAARRPPEHAGARRGPGRAAHPGEHGGQVTSRAAGAGRHAAHAVRRRHERPRGVGQRASAPPVRPRRARLAAGPSGRAAVRRAVPARHAGHAGHAPDAELADQPPAAADAHVPGARSPGSGAAGRRSRAGPAAAARGRPQRWWRLHRVSGRAAGSGASVLSGGGSAVLRVSGDAGTGRAAAAAAQAHDPAGAAQARPSAGDGHHDRRCAAARVLVLRLLVRPPDVRAQPADHARPAQRRLQGVRHDRRRAHGRGP
ncbi:substrate-binding domain-containing protein [Nonomuraea antimicrobica]